MDWILTNWEYILVVVFVLEKVVKLTPWPYDDIIFDMVIKPVVQTLAEKKTK